MRIAAASLVVLLAGCAGRRTLVDAFPPAGTAAPWVLQGAVWTGSFDEATPGFGAEAEAWQPFQPRRVWLAVYAHQDTQRLLKVRCLEFAGPGPAEQAFVARRPWPAETYRFGDSAVANAGGVLFRWGNLVFDVFGDDASWGSEVQAAFLASQIVRRMPPECIQRAEVER